MPPLIRAALRSPLLPWWLVLALLPWGRSSEIGTLLCCVGTVLLLLREPWAIRSHPGARLWLILIGAYIAAAVLSSIGSWAPARSWLASLGLLRLLPLGWYACFAMRRQSRVQHMYMATAAVVALWALDGWVQIATGWSLGGPAEADRITGIFGAANLKLGPVLAVLAPFVLWAAGQRWGRRGTVLAWLLIAAPVILSGARSAWIELAVVGLCFAWQALASWRRMAVLLLVVGVAGSVLAGIGWQYSSRFHARAERSLQLLDGSRQGLDTALTGRLQIWDTSGRMFAHHPLLGVGVRAFRVAYPSYAEAGDHFVAVEHCAPGQGACHPHQWLLEVLTETGLVGAGCWLAALIVAWRSWYRASLAARQRTWPASVALLAALFPFNTHLAFYSAWWGLLFAWLLALWCAALYADVAEPNDGRP